MFAVKFNLLQVSLVVLLLSEQCCGNISCFKHIKEKYLNRKGTTTSNNHTEDLWMDSVMFRNILRWKTKNGSYTVYKKVYYKDKWTSVGGCTNISRTFCDLKNLRTLFCYKFKVGVERNQKKFEILGPIYFYPEHETKLLPLHFEASRSNGNIFIDLNKDEYNHIWYSITFFTYQIKYWIKNKDNSDNNRGSNKTFEFQDGRTEETISVENSEMTYCVAFRFYTDSYAGYTTETSAWSEPKCLEPPQKVVNNADQVITVVTVAAFLLLASVVLYVGCKKYKKFVKDDNSLPEYLAAVKQEIDERDEALSSSQQTLSAHEQPDPIEDTSCYVRLDPNVYIHPVFVDLCWGVRTTERKCSFYSDHHEFNYLGQDEIEGSGKALMESCSNKRVRIRSRGYHSFSSDDVTADDVATLPYDWDNEADCTNISGVFHQSVDCDDNGRDSNQCVSCKGEEYVWSIEDPLASRYVNTKKKALNNNVSVGTLLRRNESDSLLLTNRHPPCQNLSYCSHLYGNVPDALVKVTNTGNAK